MVPRLALSRHFGSNHVGSTHDGSFFFCALDYNLFMAGAERLNHNSPVVVAHRPVMLNARGLRRSPDILVLLIYFSGLMPIVRNCDACGADVSATDAADSEPAGVSAGPDV